MIFPSVLMPKLLLVIYELFRRVLTAVIINLIAQRTSKNAIKQADKTLD